MIAKNKIPTNENKVKDINTLKLFFCGNQSPRIIASFPIYNKTIDGQKCLK